MSRPVSHARVVGAIVRKDLGEYVRDRLWAFLTVLTIVFVILIFWLLPDDVDEAIDVGIAGLPHLLPRTRVGKQVVQIAEITHAHTQRGPHHVVVKAKQVAQLVHDRRKQIDAVQLR